MKKVDYYQTGAGREVIDEIEDNFGALGTAFFCSGNVIKYKYRKGKKMYLSLDEICKVLSIEPEDFKRAFEETYRQTFEEYCKDKDTKKENWYSDKATEYLDKYLYGQCS